MAATTEAKDQASFQTVQVEALVVMKITKHCSSTFPTTATGAIVGMENNGVLEVTNAFAFPAIDAAALEAASHERGNHQNDASALAAAAPRTKANIAYQTEMVRQLKEVNVDANSIGFYTSATMGNFVNMSLIENLYHYQRGGADPAAAASAAVAGSGGAGASAVALVYDVSRSSHGPLNLRAFRLSASFMAAYKEGKFSTESLQKSKLSYRDILVELPVVVHNSLLLTTFLNQLPGATPPATAEVPLPASLSDIERHPVGLPPFPALDATLDLTIDPFLEKSCDLLVDSIEAHYTDNNNHQYYQRQLAREQQKIQAWQTKRKAENAQRALAKQAPLPEDEWQRLFKLPQEPSRLEGMLNARQVDQYSRQIDGFTANVSAKMFAVRGNLLPE